MMNEAELYIMKGRLLEGRRHKAQRGDLLNEPPLGYVRGPDGDDQLDPDAPAQPVVRLIFDIFEQQGSLHGVLRYLTAHDIRLPIRPTTTSLFDMRVATRYAAAVDTGQQQEATYV